MKNEKLIIGTLCVAALGVILCVRNNSKKNEKVIPFDGVVSSKLKKYIAPLNVQVKQDQETVLGELVVDYIVKVKKGLGINAANAIKGTSLLSGEFLSKMKSVGYEKLAYPIVNLVSSIIGAYSSTVLANSINSKYKSFSIELNSLGYGYLITPLTDYIRLSLSSNAFSPVIYAIKAAPTLKKQLIELGY